MRKRIVYSVRKIDMNDRTEPGRTAYIGYKQTKVSDWFPRGPLLIFSLACLITLDWGWAVVPPEFLLLLLLIIDYYYYFSAHSTSPTRHLSSPSNFLASPTLNHTLVSSEFILLLLVISIAAASITPFFLALTSHLHSLHILMGCHSQRFWSLRSWAGGCLTPLSATSEDGSHINCIVLQFPSSMTENFVGLTS